MNMSMGYGKADADESIRLLNECLDAGYTFLDTASMYGMGHNEKLIGDNLSHRRDEYVLASKCGIVKNEKGGTRIDGSPQNILKTCEESLTNLKTDVIDLYYLHRLDPKIPIEDSIGALADLVKQGKIKTIGLSEVCEETTRRAYAVHPLTAIQSEYSLWTRTPERRILSVCAELGISFVPFSPLGRSFLTGVTLDSTQVDKEDLRATIGLPRFKPESFQQNLSLLKPFGEIARQLNCSLAQLALAWILARENQTMIPIPGTKDVDHMHENAGAGDIRLDIYMVQALDELINEKTVQGRRYTDALMASTDSERD
jgi:aryl-alcohol dehydrogenase-like predicted oxidoreductase